MNMKENRIERNATIRSRALRGLLLALCLLLVVGGAALADGESESQSDPQQEPVVQEHTEHDFSVFVEKVSEANCASPAVMRYKCSGCDLTEDRTEGEKNAANHVGGTEVRGSVAATCEGAGYTGDTYCLGCNTLISKGQEIAALNHKWDEGVVTTQATCSTEGVKTFTCQNDATHTYTESIPVDENAHDWGEWEETPATCTEDGSRTHTCKLDESHTETEVLPALGHNTTATAAKDATCEETGNIAYWYCDRCEKYFSDEACTTEITKDKTVIAALDHDWNAPSWTVSADKKTAVATFVCKLNSAHVYTATCDLTETVLDEPTSDEKGKKEYTGSVTGPDGETCTDTVSLQNHTEPVKPEPTKPDPNLPSIIPPPTGVLVPIQDNRPGREHSWQMLAGKQ